jgi:hypothetical protein
VLATPAGCVCGWGGPFHCGWFTDVNGGGDETGVVGCELKLLVLWSAEYIYFNWFRITIHALQNSIENKKGRQTEARALPRASPVWPPGPGGGPKFGLWLYIEGDWTVAPGPVWTTPDCETGPPMGPEAELRNVDMGGRPELIKLLEPLWSWAGDKATL